MWSSSARHFWDYRMLMCSTLCYMVHLGSMANCNVRIRFCVLWIKSEGKILTWLITNLQFHEYINLLYYEYLSRKEALTLISNVFLIFYPASLNFAIWQTGNWEHASISIISTLIFEIVPNIHLYRWYSYMHTLLCDHTHAILIWA